MLAVDGRTCRHDEEVAVETVSFDVTDGEVVEVAAAAADLLLFGSGGAAPVETPVTDPSR